MKIGIIGSMQFTEEMIKVKEELISLGHEAYLTDLHTPFIGKSWDEIEKIKIHQKNNLDAIREFWNKMQGGEAVLVLNLDKNGIKNYIGANTFLEMGYAKYKGKKIFILNPLPNQKYINDELLSFEPMILNGDFSLIS